MTNDTATEAAANSSSRKLLADEVSLLRFGMYHEVIVSTTRAQ